MQNQLGQEQHITLSLDLPLHQALQKQLMKFMQDKAPRYLNQDAYNRSAKYLCATVLDATTGEVLALPAWPSLNWTDPQTTQEFFAQTNARQSTAASNWNFDRHVVGSTIKPLLFSTVTAGLRPTLHLENVSVYIPTRNELGADGGVRTIGGIQLERPFNVLEKTDRQALGHVVTPQEFLPCSYDLPAVVYGFMGTVPANDNNDYIKRYFKQPTHRHGDIVLDGKQMLLDLTNCGTFTTQTRVVKVNQSFKDSVYSTMLPKIAPIHISDDPTAGLEEDAQAFLPSLMLPTASKTESSRVSDTVRNTLLPERILPGAANIISPRNNLTSMFVGGSEWGRFSNVVMAEIGARLISGKAVTATLESREGHLPDFSALPTPLDDADWREANLIHPLWNMPVIGTGRQYHLKQRDGRYYIIYKSGTLNATPETDMLDDESLLCVVGLPNSPDAFHGFAQGKGKTVVIYLHLRKSTRR